jgi:DNA (cytosine-5)-methyltransferase 1
MLIHPRRIIHPVATFRFIDLFAGIGGLRIPFDNLGGKCVFSSEIDDAAARTYYANFGEMPQGDITKIDAADIPKHDLLLAGFPCQPFSIAGVSKNISLGREHGFSHAAKGTLFFDVVRVLKHHQPKAFVLENVKGLVGHDKGNTFKVIKNTLEKELNYKIYHKVLNAKYVVPQNRERIFIVGLRDDLTEEFVYPDLSGEGPKLGSILEKKLSENDLERFTLSDHLWGYLQDYKKKHTKAGNGFGFGLVGKKDVARTLSARYYKDGSEILIKQKGKNPRKVTHVEARRLMGFPEGFKTHPTQAYKQFGNAVVPMIVDTFAPKLIKILNQHTKPYTVESKQSLGDELKKIIEMMTGNGAKNIYFKPLAANDNSKNQIYVGGNLASASIFKFNANEVIHEGEGRRQRAKVKTPFSWLQSDGNLSEAKQSKLIMYPQYPEVRFSGFLSGCKSPPSCLSGREEGRLLIIGVCEDSTIGYVATKSNLIIQQAMNVSSAPTPSAFREIIIKHEQASIHEALSRIIHNGPHRPCILKRVDGTKVEQHYSITNNNVAGYTMEAKLGILPNGDSKPDYEGYEVKTLSNTNVTLMTPEPDSGIYKDQGLKAFLERYGYPGDSGEYRLSKRHKVGVKHPDTGLTLTIDYGDFHPMEKRFNFSGSISLVEDDGTVAASWKLERFISHWLTKHSSTVIVRAKKVGEKISYFPEVIFCQGPDPVGLIEGFVKGHICWDPGLKESKRRNQFRITFNNLKKSNLWAEMKVQTL